MATCASAVRRGYPAVVRALALLLVVMVPVIGCEPTATSSPHAGSDDPPPPAQAPLPAARPPASALHVDPRGCAVGVLPVSPSVQRGVCFAHNYQSGGARGYGSEVSRASLGELSALGVTWVSLTPFGFMDGPAATEVRHVGAMRAGETDARMRAEIAAARDAGLSVLLKPHLWIRGGVFLGDIDPGSEAGWRAWFHSYQEWIVRYARLAQELGVPLLAVGVEFGSSSGSREADWRAVIAAVRAVYEGELVYAANWDEVGSVPFWDALDYVGVQFYPPLATRLDESPEAVTRRVATHLDALGALSTRVDRPVLLTEVGYKSVRGTALRPHEWPEHMQHTPEPSEAEQALCYRLLLNAVAERPFIRGVYWWKWFSDPDAQEEGPNGFSPRGKLAEAVLRAAYSPRCASP